MHRPILPYFAALGFTAIFGFSFLFSRTALFHIAPMHLLAFRFLLAALTMQTLRYFGLIKIAIRPQDRMRLFYLSLLQPIVYFTCETIGIAHTSASEAGLVVATIPVFTVLMAYVCIRERPTALQVSGILTSVVGVAFITLLQATNLGQGNLFGLLLLFAAALSAGGYSVLSRYLSDELTAIDRTYAMMNTGAIFFFGMSLFEHAVHGQLASFWAPLTTAPVLAAVFYLGLLSSCGAFFLMNYALGHLTAAQVGAFPSLTTVIAIAAGVILLNEQLFWYHGIGGVLIIAGVWATNYFGYRPTSNQSERVPTATHSKAGGSHA